MATLWQLSERDNRLTASYLMKKFQGDPNTTTLADAQSWLRGEVDDGAECPCCTQDAKVYKRTITSSMAYALILIERYFRVRSGWLHVPSYLSEASKVGVTVRGGDFAKLRYWGLLEEKDETRDDGSPRAGYYRITPDGVEFVHSRKRVRKFVFLYDDRALKRSAPEMISIEDALGEKFSYMELMKPYTPNPEAGNG